MTTILRIDSSARRDGSYTRAVADNLLAAIAGPDDSVVTRDLLAGVPLLDEPSTNQLATPVDDRSPDAASTLATADELIAELVAADVVVISVPIYNFGVPASLKAWADLVARAGTTFAYTEAGPAGLLDDRPVYVVAGSGGVPIGSDFDHATPWLRQFLGFLGLTNVQVIPVEGLAFAADDGVTAAQARIAELTAPVG